jgi:membrane-associated HD superfamily phosphohydrolase
MDEREKKEVNVSGAMSRLGGGSKLDKQANPTPVKKKEESSSKSIADTFLELAPLLIGTVVGGLPAGLDAQTQVGAVNQASTDRKRQQEQQDAKLQLEQQNAGLNQEKFEFQKDVQQINELDRTDQRDLQRQQLDQRQQQFSQDLDFRNKALQQDAAIQYDRLSVAQKKQFAKENPSLESRLSGLGGEEKKRFDGVKMGLTAVGDLKNAIDQGVNKFSLVGDNPYTFAANRFVEAIGRLQSGGAINEQEVENFKKLIPGVTDSKQISELKLKTLQEDLSSRLNTLGFAPEELGISSTQSQQAPEMSKRQRLEALRKKHAR